jgi:hypothetical protein
MPASPAASDFRTGELDPTTGIFLAASPIISILRTQARFYFIDDKGFKDFAQREQIAADYADSEAKHSKFCSF